ncbi:MAG: 4Fe-4S dicluster domain-containing protein [Desulfobacula sp.]
MSSQYFIEWNSEFCTGCRLCELMCSSRFNKGVSPSKSAIRWENESIRVCLQCSEPECKKACKLDAIDVAIDDQKCIGCGLCVSACPHESIFQSEKKSLPLKCDLCNGQPECVSFCPANALSLARKGRWPAFFRRMKSKSRWVGNEISLILKTKLNNGLMLMARERIIRIRAGRKDSFLNRVILSPMVEPFKKNFFSGKEGE